jgi:hypothetical protein
VSHLDDLRNDDIVDLAERLHDLVPIQAHGLLLNEDRASCSASVV